MYKIIIVCLMMILVVCADGRAKVASKAVEETLEIAAKRSGKVLSKTAEKKLGVELLEFAGKYGDDVMPIVREGGLEVIEQGAKLYCDNRFTQQVKKGLHNRLFAA